MPFWHRRGQRVEGRQWLEQALDRPGSESAPPEVRANALLSAAMLARTQLDTDRAITQAEEALEIFRAVENRLSTLICLNLLCAMLRARGSLREANAYGMETLRLLEEQDKASLRAIVLCNLGTIAYWLGDLDRAADLLEDALALYRGTNGPWGIGFTLHDLGMVAITRGERDRAAAFLSEAIETCRMLGAVESLIDILFAVGALAMLVDRPETAVRLFAAADAEARNQSYHLDEPRKAHDEKLMNRARATLQSGFDSYWDEGSTLTLEDAVATAQTVLADARKEREAPRQAGADSPLTAREREVLALLAEGKTDREIGEILFISHRTVMSHVANIFAKIGVRTRTAAAAYAQRIGI
jgi:non-specific serine/threonine protein kinase